MGVGEPVYARLMPRRPSPSELREMRQTLRDFNNLYVEYLNLTYPSQMGSSAPEPSGLRMELRARMAGAQNALRAAGVDLTLLPPPAFGGPVLQGLPNTIFAHENWPVYPGMGPPIYEKVIECLLVADSYLERHEKEETRRRKNPLYWADLALTAFLGIPAYIVSRVIGVPVWKIDDSPIGFVLRLLGLAIDGLVVFFGGRGLHWW